MNTIPTRFLNTIHGVGYSGLPSPVTAGGDGFAAGSGSSSTEVHAVGLIYFGFRFSVLLRPRLRLRITDEHL